MSFDFHEASHATLIDDVEPRMSRRLTTRGWVWAAAASFWIHAALLSLLVQRSRRVEVTAPALAWAAASEHQQRGAEPVEPTWVEVTTSDQAQPLPLLPEIEPFVPPPASLRDAPEGEMARDRPLSVAPRVADAAEKVSPAADQGLDLGRKLDHAWRRDRSTLRSRITDGAAIAQPSRARTSVRSSSPQAVRREPITGIGDSVKSEVPGRLPLAAQYGEPDPDAPGTGTETVEGARAAPPSPSRPDFPRVTDVPVATRGEGPLDSETGERNFDSERRGLAADNQTLRAASNELRPGLTDFSRPAVAAPLDSPNGRGPGVTPGAVAQTSRGTAPAQQGARTVHQIGPQVTERSQDRTYDRYIQEITRRVNKVTVFPKTLALRLEQGETIVHFVLRTDGKIIDGVRVVKSSGFEEFDSAAARAVQDAAPFPPVPPALQARTMSVRVAFENPVIR
jgi:TonB family protein